MGAPVHLSRDVGGLFCYLLSVLRVVGQLVLLVLLADVELGVKLELLALLQHLEILGGVLDDVGGLVAQHLPREVSQDLLEACGHWVLLQVLAGHLSYIIYK